MIKKVEIHIAVSRTSGFAGVVPRIEVDVEFEGDPTVGTQQEMLTAATDCAERLAEGIKVPR